MMPDPIRIPIEDIQRAEEYRKYINSLDLNNIEITEMGRVYPIPKECIEEFRVCGLSNWTFFADGLFKTDMVTLFLHEEEDILKSWGFVQDKEQENVWYTKPDEDHAYHTLTRQRRSFLWEWSDVYGHYKKKDFRNFVELEYWWKSMFQDSDER